MNTGWFAREHRGSESPGWNQSQNHVCLKAFENLCQSAFKLSWLPMLAQHLTPTLCVAFPFNFQPSDTCNCCKSNVPREGKLKTAITAEQIVWPHFAIVTWVVVSRRRCSPSVPPADLILLNLSAKKFTCASKNIYRVHCLHFPS